MCCDQEQVDQRKLIAIAFSARSRISSNFRFLSRSLGINQLPATHATQSRSRYSSASEAVIPPVGKNLISDSGAESAFTDILDTALDLFETVVEPGKTAIAPYVWPQGEAWKETIFTAEQPFLEGEAYDNWVAAKQRYRNQKKEQS